MNLEIQDMVGKSENVKIFAQNNRFAGQPDCNSLRSAHSDDLRYFKPQTFEVTVMIQ